MFDSRSLLTAILLAGAVAVVFRGEAGKQRARYVARRISAAELRHQRRLLLGGWLFASGCLVARTGYSVISGLLLGGGVITVLASYALRRLQAARQPPAA